jgi:hypothetical protein
MKRNVYLMLLAAMLGAVCVARPDSDRWPIAEQETIEKTLTLSGEPMRLVVDNLNGYVHVTGVDGSQVHVVAHKTIRAQASADLAQAKSEVRLDMTEQPGSVSIEYNAPWICRGDCHDCCGGRRERFYEVRYEIEVQAPRSARVAVREVNGQIQVEHIDGDFDVRGVNGGIRMGAIGGSGDVHTVNGPVSIQFARNPRGECIFKSVNGSLDAEFQPGISADLAFKTLHGGIYSDFEVAPLPVSTAGAERKNGMFVYRSSRESRGRAGKGGPLLSFETVNGEIRLHEQSH